MYSKLVNLILISLLKQISDENIAFKMRLLQCLVFLFYIGEFIYIPLRVKKCFLLLKLETDLFYIKINNLFF